MEDIPAVEDTVTFAADTIENFANYISRTSVERLAADASRFVKRYPVAVIAAGVTVGLVAIVAASQSKISGLGRYDRRKGTVRSTRRPPTGRILTKSRGAKVAGLETLTERCAFAQHWELIFISYVVALREA